MKYHETDNYSFLLGNNHYVYDHKEDENSLHLFVKSKPHSCKCPECGQESRKLHATYKRDLQDTPIHCKQTYLHANVYKYECENPSCACKVFTETLPFAKSSQVRTDALNSLILGVSMFLSNEGASKVLALLGVKVSNDTIHLLQNLLEYLKDIFKAEMPSAIYIKDGKILEQAPEKIQREKKLDKKYLSTLHYDNSPPMNPDGSEHLYDNKNHCLSRKQYKDQAENRKKNGS